MLGRFTMFSTIKQLFASDDKVFVTNDSVSFEMSAAGWRHFRSDATDHIESFRKDQHVLNVNVRKYKRSDGGTPTDDMVRDAVVTLSRETPTEIFKERCQWIGHYESGEPGCAVDNWHIAVLSPQGELMVATVIVMFTDESTRTEIRAALSEATLTRL
jgi:hypothetical protein